MVRRNTKLSSSATSTAPSGLTKSLALPAEGELEVIPPGLLRGGCRIGLGLIGKGRRVVSKTLGLFGLEPCPGLPGLIVSPWGREGLAGGKIGGKVWLLKIQLKKEPGAKVTCLPSGFAVVGGAVDEVSFFSDNVLDFLTMLLEGMDLLASNGSEDRFSDEVKKGRSVVVGSSSKSSVTTAEEPSVSSMKVVDSTSVVVWGRGMKWWMECLLNGSFRSFATGIE